MSRYTDYRLSQSSSTSRTLVGTNQNQVNRSNRLISSGSSSKREIDVHIDAAALQQDSK